MKHLLLLLVLLSTAGPRGRAAIVYSGIQNVAIPLDFNGVYFRIDTGVSTLVAPGDYNTAPWMNAFFGGVDIGNGALMRPVITSIDQILNLAPGTLVSGASNFVVGQSGSSTHAGLGAGQFALNVPGYMGATFRETVGGPDYYGWVQMEISNVGAGKIISWAVENVSGASIQAGDIGAVPEPGTVVLSLAMIFLRLNQRTRRRH